LSSAKDESVKSFMEVLERFTEDLDVAMVNLQDSVKLSPCAVNLDSYKKPSEYANAAHDPTVVEGLESKRTFNFRLGGRMVQANRAGSG
jgi:dynein heavy chain, axonemal